MADEASDNKSMRLAIERTNTPKAPSFCDIYTNDTFVQFTPWDCRLMLSILTELGPNQKETGVLRVADVRMSLQHAKKVAQILTAHIKRYEEKNGPLNVPGDGEA